MQKITEIPQKPEKTLLHDAAIPQSDMYPKELRAVVLIDIVHILHDSRAQCQTERTSSDRLEMIDKLNAVDPSNAMLLSKEGVLTYTTILTKPKAAMLRVISQLQKGKCCVSHLYEGLKAFPFTETKQDSGCQGQRS